MKIIQEYPLKIFKKEYDGKTYYRLGISKKNQTGNYVNGYIDARFRKDTEVDTDKKIYIDDAWLDFYLDKDGKTKLFIFINAFKYVEEAIKESKGNETIKLDEMELTDAELPF